VESYAAQLRPIDQTLIDQSQHDGNRGEFQPERRILADFDGAIENVAHRARSFPTTDGIDPDDNQVAFRDLTQKRSKRRVSGKAAIPIRLAIDFHRGKQLRHAGRRQQRIDRYVLMVKTRRRAVRALVAHTMS
jgi:hypothetical protein